MQIMHIHDLNPKSMIEIGVGNGLTSTFMRDSGIPVTTSDINPNLDPDICCPIAEIVEKVGERTYDLVVCCEVLEHMPVDQIEDNIKTLRSLGNRLYLTLPSYAYAYGFSFLMKIPFVKAKDFFFHFFLPKKINLSKTEHYWEVGSEAATKRKSIINVLKRHYTEVRSGRISFQPSQIYFVAE